jgi:predicted nucleic acid-binding protein
MLVIDASAVTELLLARRHAPAVERAILEHRGNLHAPGLLDVEVLSALRRLVVTAITPAERAGQAVGDFQALSIERYDHEALIPRVWALRENFSASDAVYVALAEVLTDAGVPLLTADRRLARAIRDHLELKPILAS